MKLIKSELRNTIMNDVRDKVLEHSPWDSPVHQQIGKNFGWWNENNLFRLKTHNTKWHIIGDLGEST